MTENHKIISTDRKEQIVRVGDLVHRPIERWTKQIHNFLTSLRQNGFNSAPEPFGLDLETGKEIVSYIQGEIIDYPLHANAASVETLKSAASLLKNYHDATLSFFRSANYDNELWKLPPRQAAEVICHGDFAPYNAILQERKVTGIIDFDTCHPGPRSWDVAYAIYRWCPITNPSNPDNFGCIEQQAARAAIFCDAYDLKHEDRDIMPQIIIARLEALIEFMHKEAGAGNYIYQANIQKGHAQLYKDDIIYIKRHEYYIRGALTS